MTVSAEGDLWRVPAEAQRVVPLPTGHVLYGEDDPFWLAGPEADPVTLGISGEVTSQVARLADGDFVVGIREGDEGLWRFAVP